MTEVAVHHLQTVIEAPQRSRESVTDTRETTTRSRVRLEHDERLAGLLRDARRVEVRLDGVDTQAVIEELGELDLGVLRGTERLVDLTAVVVGVAIVTST